MENRLTMIGETDQRSSDRHILYEYLCSCGNTVYLAKRTVSKGNTKSCGCLKKEVSAKAVVKLRKSAAHGASLKNRTHGMRNTRFWTIYRGMLWRCKDKSNKHYGGRGIKVCDRWKESFENFRDDMYESYLVHCKQFGETRSGTSIDRIDVNGNYELSNCRWATAKEQYRNKR